MKIYYRAVTQDGKTIRGLIDAKNEKEAAEYLRNHQFLPIKIVREKPGGMLRYFPFLQRSSLSDVVFFTRQLASIMGSGLTLMQSLQILHNQLQNKNAALQGIVQNLINDVQDGKRFSDALERYPKMFSPIYIALIRTAETSGLLDKSLLRLAENLEKQQELRRTIQGALLYPLIVILMMIVVIIIMMIFVIPQLSSLYTEMAVDLPASTAVVIGLSNFAVTFWPFILGGGLFLTYVTREWYKKPVGRKLIDTYLLKMPIFGKLMSETMMAEFTRTFSVLISSGSLVVDSLNKSSAVVGNVLYQEAIVTVGMRVEKGISIGDAMEASPLFPPMVVEMVKIGEQTGKLDESLMRASDYYEREVSQTVKTLTTLLEPAIMILLALGVGFLIFAVITPIYSLISSF
ncbi:MAG: type II secretion system F family protein [Patescibacteria group bacterium]